MIFTVNVSPCYQGELIFGIINLDSCKVEIELGARVAYVMFYEVKGETNLHRGQWQGGRASAEQKKQV